MLEVFDNEFIIWSPTLKDLGNNPVDTLPAGGSIGYSTDKPDIAQMSFAARTSSTGVEYPALPEDGSKGTYIGSGGIGSCQVTATPIGLPETFQTQSDTFTSKATVAGSMNMSGGAAMPE